MQQDRSENLMITKYGYDVFFTIAAVCVVIILLALLFIEPKSYRYSIIVVSLAVLGFVTSFFRDPERITPKGENLIIAPADVHVNRNPISGVVKHTRYVKGEYFAAFEDKASEKNEQMIVGLENANGKVMFKQIAGFIARRIVCSLKSGDTVNIGERFGMIKFGSRVDVFLPLSVDLKTNTGDITIAGETILGEFLQSGLEKKSK